VVIDGSFPRVQTYTVAEVRERTYRAWLVAYRMAMFKDYMSPLVRAYNADLTVAPQQVAAAETTRCLTHQSYFSMCFTLLGEPTANGATQSFAQITRR
jgi:hypothetical protein